MEQQADTDQNERGNTPGGTRHNPPAFYHPYSRPTTQPSKARLRFLGAAAIVVISGSAGFLGGWLGNNQAEKPTVQTQQVVLKSQGELLSSIANNVGKSVVSVDTTTTNASASFFGYGGEEQGAGTGIIISKDGLIMTNRHVVPAGTSKVSITLSDGTKFDDVEVIGRTAEGDPLDVAFLKIKDTKGKELTAATIGDSSKSKVGDPVLAIGNALGQFQNTVTSGIISGYGRSLQASDDSGSSTENLENLFQTDAAINPGNSGGPLVNLDGQVIGINTAVAGDAQSIGFSIPINDVKGLITSVEEKGKLERPFLGVVFIPITADMAKQYELSTNEGAFVPPANMTGQAGVVSDGPADKAGIKEGDILTKIDGEKIDESHSLTSLLGKHKVGDTIKLTYLRDGKERTADITLGTAPTQ